MLEVVRGIVAQDYAVVMTTHDPNHAILLGGTVAVLDRTGTLRVGPSEEVLTEEMLRGLYRTDVRVAYVERVSRNAVVGAMDDIVLPPEG